MHRWKRVIVDGKGDELRQKSPGPWDAEKMASIETVEYYSPQPTDPSMLLQKAATSTFPFQLFFG